MLSAVSRRHDRSLLKSTTIVELSLRSGATLRRREVQRLKQIVRRRCCLTRTALFDIAVMVDVLSNSCIVEAVWRVECCTTSSCWFRSSSSLS